MISHDQVSFISQTLYVMEENLVLSFFIFLTFSGYKNPPCSCANPQKMNYSFSEPLNALDTPMLFVLVLKKAIQSLQRLGFFR